eukprot:scaffold907_cov55-Attheya_sp.AAC.1
MNTTGSDSFSRRPQRRSGRVMRTVGPLSLLATMSLILYCTQVAARLPAAAMVLSSRNWGTNNSQKKDGGRPRRRSSLQSTKSSWEETTPKFTTRQQLPPLVLTSERTSSSVPVPEFNNNPDSHAEASESCYPHACGPLDVVYTNDAKTIDQWLADHLPNTSGATVLGFDVESVPVAPWIKGVKFEGPATIQLSTPDACLVAHLTRPFGKRRSTACRPMEALLSDETIIKAGVGIDEDMLELYRWNRRLVAKSRFDVGGVGASSPSKNTRGLKSLVTAVLGVELEKSKKVARSDWSKVPLTKKQVAYGARDAWAGAAIMFDLAKRDPNAFGSDAILSLLKATERPIHEVHLRAQQRKAAKLKVKAMNLDFRESTDLDKFESYANLRAIMPPLVRDEVQRLEEVIAETAPDRPPSFDTQPLGVEFHAD